jgi:hypothetical protein
MHARRRDHEPDATDIDLRLAAPRSGQEADAIPNRLIDG